MRTLTPAERRTFRAKAHHLHPFVSIGQHGLTPAVLHEIDVNLLAHELIKIRVSNDDRGERDALLARICGDLNAAPVQHLGKILTIWRPAPEPEPEKAVAKPRAKSATAKPRKKPAGGTNKRRTAKPRDDEKRQHYRATPVAPRGEASTTTPSGARSRRRRAAPREETNANGAGQPRVRRRTPG